MRRSQSGAPDKECRALDLYLNVRYSPHPIFSGSQCYQVRATREHKQWVYTVGSENPQPMWCPLRLSDPCPTAGGVCSWTCKQPRHLDLPNLQYASNTSTNVQVPEPSHLGSMGRARTCSAPTPPRPEEPLRFRDYSSA